MRNNTQKEPLFRKVNTTARGIRHDFGGDFRHDRNTKEQVNSESTRGSMGKTKKRGLDYTPLYKFLLSKVGKDWTATHKEAISRIDREEPIFHLVALNDDEKTTRGLVRVGESSYYSQLFIDENNILQKVIANVGPEDVPIGCPCCTYTFNGSPLGRKFSEEAISDYKW